MTADFLDGFLIRLRGQIDLRIQKKLPFRFDQRHTVNVVLNYQLNSWLDLGIRWQYGSGFPYSEPLGIKPRIILADNDLDGKPETPVIATRRIHLIQTNRK